MQFSVVALFAASALAASSQTGFSTQTTVSTEIDTITSCDSSVPSCPARNESITSSIYSGAADMAYGSYYAAGAAALAAGALLI